jgi:hypothetical protein
MSEEEEVEIEIEIEEEEEEDCDCCGKGWGFQNEFGICSCFCHNCAYDYSECRGRCYRAGMLGTD